MEREVYGRMKAKEMFEELGYKLIKDDDYCEAYTCKDSGGFERGEKIILIDKIDKSFIVYHYDFIEDKYDEEWVIVKEYQAITQRMHELGWLDD